MVQNSLRYSSSSSSSSPVFRVKLLTTATRRREKGELDEWVGGERKPAAITSESTTNWGSRADSETAGRGRSAAGMCGRVCWGGGGREAGHSKNSFFLINSLVVWTFFQKETKLFFFFLLWISASSWRKWEEDPIWCPNWSWNVDRKSISFADGRTAGTHTSAVST